MNSIDLEQGIVAHALNSINKGRTVWPERSDRSYVELDSTIDEDFPHPSRVIFRMFEYVADDIETALDGMVRLVFDAYPKKGGIIFWRALPDVRPYGISWSHGDVRPRVQRHQWQATCRLHIKYFEREIDE